MSRMNLVNALREAAAELNARGAAPLLDEVYDDRKDLANYLVTAAEQVEMGCDDALPELRRIFAPTSTWDDTDGSQEIGNKIDRMLEHIT